MSIPIIDIEASGLHLDSYPIEIALLIDGVMHTWLVKPEPNWLYWSESAEEMHGISREQLEYEGVAAAEVAAQINGLANGRNNVLYSDAAYWDGDWLKTLFYAAGQSLQWRVRSIFDVLSEEEVQAFAQIKNDLTASGHYQVHRAGDDAKLLLHAYLDAKKS